MSAPEIRPRSRWSVLRVVSWAFVVLILVVVLLITAVMQPSVQQRILERQLLRSGARDIQLAGIRLTPFSFRADHLAFVHGGLRVDAHGIRLTVRPRPLFSHEIHLEGFTGQSVDVAIDVASTVSPAAQAKPAAAEPARSVATHPLPLQLPWKVFVGSFDVGGSFSVHRGIVQLEAGQWHLSGGGLAPGSTGTISYELKPKPPAGVTGGGGRVFGSLALPESMDGQIGNARFELSLEAIPLAWANLAANPKGFDIRDGSLSGKLLATSDAAGTTVLAGSSVQVTNLKVAKNTAAAANRPQGVALSFELLRPYVVDPADPFGPLEKAGNADWARVTIANVPLEAAAPWLPGRQLAGTWVRGDAVLRYLTGKGAMLTATAPWQFSDVSLAEGGAELFHGSLAIKPTCLYTADTRWVRFTDFAAEDSRGYQVAAHGGIVLKGKEDQVAGGITLQASLPFFPGLPEKKGPYGVALSATAHVLPNGKNTLSKLTAKITGKAGELLASVAAQQPITIEQTPTSEWLISSPQPLQVKTAQVPLSGLESLFTARGLEASGILPATEFALWFSPRQVRVEAKTPLAVQRFHLERNHEVLIDRALLRFTPAFKVQFEHHLLPKFAVTATSSTSLKSGLIKVDGNRVGLFDLQVDLAATESAVTPKNLAGGLWLDLGALSQTGLLSHTRLPGKGEFRIEFGKSTTDPKYVEFQGGIARIFGRNGKSAPAVEFFGRAQGDFAQRSGGFGVRATIEPLPTKSATPPRPTQVHFGFKADFQHLEVLDISSHLDSDYVNLDDVMALEAAFSPAVITPATRTAAAAAAGASSAGAQAPAQPEAVPWGIVRGHFTLGIKELAMAPYSIKNLGGRLELTDSRVSLTGLSGETLGGKWTSDFSAGLQPGNAAAPVDLKAHFAMTQIDAAQAVHLRYPDPPAGIDGKLNLDVTVSGDAQTWEALPAATAGQFVMTATGGRMRLVLPKKDMISNALIIGGTFTFSKELRALGRFVKTLEDLPINQIKATGTLAQDGKLHLETISLDSPQLKLSAAGEVANAKTRDLLGEPLLVNASLAASGDMAIMLSGMNLLEKGTGAGFQKMKDGFLINGNVGSPNFQPLYDLLAKAVDGSHGTWGMLMRKVQSMVPKAVAKPTS